jgi:hypothetical protein
MKITSSEATILYEFPRYHRYTCAFIWSYADNRFIGFVINTFDSMPGDVL